MSTLQRISVRLGELSRTVPTSVRDDTKLALLHNLIVAFAAKNLAVTGAPPAGIPQARPGYARLLRDSTWVPVHRAIIGNSLLMGARAQHDEHPGSVAHFGSVIIPSLLALTDVGPFSDHEHESGRKLLDAMAVGYQAGSALASAAGAQTTPRGFRPTGIFGPFGGAAAVGIARGFSNEELTNALAFALSSGSAITQVWRDGSDEWRFQTAFAARAGFEAAELAGLGTVGAAHALEGQSGFLRAFGGLDGNEIDQAAERVLNGLDADWAVSELLLKPYPVCAINQAAVWRALQVIEEHALTPAGVESVEVRLAPGDAAYPGIANGIGLTSWAQAMMSMPHAIATSLSERTVSYEHLIPPFTAELTDIASRVTVVADSSITGGHSAVVRFRMRDGRNVGSDIPATIPRDWESTEALCTRLTPEHGLDSDTLAALTNAVRGLDGPGGLSALKALLTMLI